MLCGVMSPRSTRAWGDDDVEDEESEGILGAQGGDGTGRQYAYTKFCVKPSITKSVFHFLILSYLL